MVTTAGTLILLLCFLPSFSSAWCSGSGGHWTSPRHLRRDTAYPPSILPSLKFEKGAHHCHYHKSNREEPRVVKLWSNISNGGSQHEGVVDGTDGADGPNRKMTFRRASKLLSTFWSMAFPYYQESQPGRRLFIGMVLLTLVNSGVSVAFSYVSKDFWNALSSKDTQEFYSMMLKYGGALVVGAPVSVLYR